MQSTLELRSTQNCKSLFNMLLFTTKSKWVRQAWQCYLDLNFVKWPPKQYFALHHFWYSIKSSPGLELFPFHPLRQLCCDHSLSTPQQKHWKLKSMNVFCLGMEVIKCTITWLSSVIVTMLQTQKQSSTMGKKGKRHKLICLLKRIQS